MLRLWCEWDLGQNYVVFTSEDKAKSWLENAMSEDLWAEFSGAQEIFDAGLAGTYVVIVV